MERVLITGLGVTSCLGSDIDSYWSGLMRAHSTPVPVKDSHANMPNRLLYEVPQDASLPAGKLPGNPGRTSSFALAAARAALCDAGLGEIAQGAGGGGVGVAVGTGVGDASLFEEGHVAGTVPAGLDSFPFKVSSMLAAAFQLTGPTLSISTACSASAYAVSLAAEAIAAGQAEVIIAVGADGYTRVGVACFNRMGGLDPVRCRPFDADRRGTVFGEGAAVLVLESQAHARSRGWTRRYACVEGAGWSCDAHHATAPEPTAAQITRAMSDALASAGLTPGQVSFVIPHGTGTPLNDAIEGQALAEVFGEHTAALAAYNLKAMLGHTGGAAGAFSLLTAALLLHRQAVPPNPAASAPDPGCPITLHTGAPLRRPLRYALVNAYAFGGNNISILLGQA
jgi:3-oxoacyl-[acyl-carrier-protein] synthase II